MTFPGIRITILCAAFPVAPLLSQTVTSATSDDIVVTAAPSSQQQLIDRKVYLVKNNAEAQTQSALDVLHHVPSVTVTAKDRIQLLGDSGVKVLIDGHPVSGGANALKTLPAARIAKVEIVTNPSASFSAEGTAGVINIVTRRDAAAGLLGSGSIAGGSYGSTEIQLAPSYAGGRWTAALSLDLRHDLNQFGGSRERTAADPALNLDQVRQDEYDIADLTSRLDLAYTPRPSTKWTLGLQHDDIDASFDYRLTSLSRGSDQIPIDENYPNYNRYTHDAATFGYNWTGKRQGESLNLSANYDGVRDAWPGTVIDRFDRGTQTSDILRDATTRTEELKLDYVHPTREADVLSIGGAVTHVRETQTSGLTITDPLAAVASAPPSLVAGDRTTVAAYATFQFPLGRWKVLPGLRAEERVRNVGALGGIAHRDSLLWFPSLHLDRKLARRLDIGLSYSRRVLWPTIAQLDPDLRFSDLLDAESGNPALGPQMTNTFEAALTFTPGRQSLALKLYDRETDHSTASSATILASGVSVVAPIDAGHSRKRGGELALSGPILKGLRYSASTNIGVRRTQILEGGMLTPFDQFAYSGNFQLEYQDKADGKPGANHFALEAQYGGPTRAYQQRTGGWMDLTLRWTHNYTRRLSSVVKVSDLFLGDRDDTVLSGSNYLQIDRSKERQQRIMLSLVSRLGSLK